MKPPTLTAWRVSKLRDYLLSRQFAIPKLQRNFVWDAGRAAKLLDSIYRNMPIGSLFLWEMDRTSANLIRQSADVLPSFSPSNRLIWFVIDGQQRLSVIYQAFEAQVRHNDAGREIDFRRLCFVVNPDPEQEAPARIVYRKAVEREFIPVHDILSSDWKKRLAGSPQGLLAKLAKCREQLLSYPVPVVTVRAATLDDIGEIFIRVNSQGMRITAADRAIALMGTLDVRAMAHELRQKVRDEVFPLTGIEPILMGFNLITERPSADGDPPKLEAMARRWSKLIEDDEGEKQSFRRKWHKYQNAFRAAVDYLHHRFDVRDDSYLPSANMLATLAVFFYDHPGQPDRHQAGEIRKWFWATGVAQRYSGRGYHRNIAKDAKLFSSLAKGKRARFDFADRLDPLLDIQAAEYASRSARSRAFFCLLAAQSPRYLENGETISLDTSLSHANKKHRHHIFPRAQLKNHFPARVYNSLCNICFLVSRDNLKIGMRLPRSYLADYKQDTGSAQLKRAAKSHLIPVGEDSGVWDSGIVRAFKRFRQKRLELICGAFEKQAGIKLFRKS